MLELHQDVVWQRPGLTRRLGVLTTGEFVLNTRFQYEAMFPDTKPFRVCPIHQPICPNFDPQVHRDVGDIVEAEIAGTVGLLPGLTLMPMYTYTHKFQDQFRGDRGFNYGQLQAETDDGLPHAGAAPGLQYGPARGAAALSGAAVAVGAVP